MVSHIHGKEILLTMLQYFPLPSNGVRSPEVPGSYPPARRNTPSLDTRSATLSLARCLPHELGGSGAGLSKAVDTSTSAADDPLWHARKGKEISCSSSTSALSRWAVGKIAPSI